MTNLQFIMLLSPSIGSFVLVILGWLHQNQRLTDLRADTNRQFDSMKTGIDMRFGEVNRQFGEVNRQFEQVNQRLATLADDYRTFYGMEQKLEGRVDELSKRQ